jgi:hypothetical protein
MSELPVVYAYQLAPEASSASWLIEELWSAAAVGIIGGEPKCGKSFLALSLAVAVASGQPCLRRFPVARQGPVLLFAAEDALHTVRQRLEGLCAWQGLALRDLPLLVITAPVLRLDRPPDCQALHAALTRYHPLFLVLDPFVRLHRVDENQAAEIVPLLAFLRELQRRHGTAIAVVHHARKGAGRLRAGQALRGSSEFHAWADSSLFLRRQGAALQLTAEHRAHPSDLQLPLTLIQTNAGPALAPASTPPVAGAPAPAAPRDRVLALLQRLDQPVSLRHLRTLCQLRMATLTDILHQLSAEGLVLRSPAGWLRATPTQ